jgi:hypothetical protein
MLPQTPPQLNVADRQDLSPMQALHWSALLRTEEFFSEAVRQRERQASTSYPGS